MRLTLQFIRISLFSMIQKTGNTAISPDPWLDPSDPQKAPVSTGLAVRVYTRQLGRVFGGLRWNQVDDAMAGLQQAMYDQGMVCTLFGAISESAVRIF